VRGGIAYQIQGLRQKSGLNQTDFAEKVGKKQSVISRLENTEYGKVTVQTLLDVACANDVALVVQFVSYPDFLARTSDMSEAALQPPTIYESIEMSKQQIPLETDTIRTLVVSNVPSATEFSGICRYVYFGTSFGLAQRFTHFSDDDGDDDFEVEDVEVDSTDKSLPRQLRPLLR
jgi:transcriptional regulator with XRE-family HTH domain